jgi:hypothetical protein
MTVTIRARATVYRVDLDVEQATKPLLSKWAVLEVSNDGYCELHLWRLDGTTYKSRPFRPGDPKDAAYMESRQQMLGLLEEEELIELLPIGPEDKEWFVTEKFREVLDASPTQIC